MHSFSGLFRDVSGSYDNLYRLLGATYLILATLWLAVTYAEEHNNVAKHRFEHQVSGNAKSKS